MTVKMPDPMTAPMPSAVSDQGPRVFLSLCAGSCDSLMSLSIDLRASSWLARENLLTVVSDQRSVLLRQDPSGSWAPVCCAKQRSSALSGGCRPLIADNHLSYRFDWPRAIFFTFLFREPRGVVRLALGAAFLRAVRFSFLRSALSSIFFVSATLTSFRSSCFQCSAQRGACEISW